MHSRAKVFRRKNSPYFAAWFMAWDAKKQQWKPVMKSTRCTDQAKALEIAREFERVALAAGPNGSVRLSRDFVLGVVNDILRISGHRDIDDTPSWRSWSQQWLSTNRANERSQKNYRHYIDAFSAWLGKDADSPITTITHERLQQWYDEQVEAGLHASTVDKSISIYTSIFARAVNAGITNKNPGKLVARTKPAARARTSFTLDEVRKILAYLRTQTAPLMQDWLTVTLLALCTSQRLSDCTKAMRSHFVIGSPYCFWQLTQQKTGKALRIPLVGPLDPHIRALLAKPATSLFLAPSLAQRTRHLSEQFQTILANAGIRGEVTARKGKGRSFNTKTFHSTRHTCNSLLANAGVPIDIRRMITGHAGDEMNLVYTHLEDETKAEALAKAVGQIA